MRAVRVRVRLAGLRPEVRRWPSLAQERRAGGLPDWASQQERVTSEPTVISVRPGSLSIWGIEGAPEE